MLQHSYWPARPFDLFSGLPSGLFCCLFCLGLLSACGARSPEQQTVIGLAPIAQTDVAVTLSNQSVRIDVLANDSDPDGDSLNLADFDTVSAENGSISLNNDNSLQYTPANDFSGADSFSYQIRDADGNTSTGTVNISVQGQPAAPVSASPCRDVQTRLDAGLGYCFDAFFYTKHDRTDPNDPTTGTLIDMTVYVPHPDALRAAGTDANASDGFAPLLVHSHGFGGAKNEDFSALDHFVDNQATNRAWNNGYFAVSITQRGFGGSGGEIAFMQRELEGLDNNETVDWMIKHMRGDSNADGSAGDSIYDFVFDADNAAHITSDFDAADTRPSLLRNDLGARLSPQADCPNEDDESCDPALGALGYSYGGGWQYNVSVTDSITVSGRTPQDRWDALIPEGTWHDLRYSLHANDVPKSYWASLLFSFAVQGGTAENGTPTPVFLNGVFAAAQGPAAGAAICDQGAGNPTAAGISAGRVCAPDQNFLGNNGTNKYCDPVNGALTKASLFHLQGVRDTLFNFNEGYNNAKCFRDAGNDVRFIAVSGGHPFTLTTRAPYTGNRTAMDIDEVIHCAIDQDLDGDGDNTPNDGDLVQERMYVDDLMFRWFEEKLRGQTGEADVIPDVCITQHNTDASDQLTDANFFFDGNDEFYYLKEGLSYNDIDGGATALDQILIGAGDTPNYVCDTGASARCPVNATVQLVGAAGVVPGTFVPLYTVPENSSQVMAGIPTAKLNIAGRAADLSGLAVDPIIFLGITIQRDGQMIHLHDQLTPIRDTNTFPWADPYGVVVNDIEDNDNTETPLYYGCGSDAETLCDRGRLAGITARLRAGDVVGLEIRNSDLQYPSAINKSTGPLTITGNVELPLLPASPLPETNTAYNPE